MYFVDTRTVSALTVLALYVQCISAGNTTLPSSTRNEGSTVKPSSESNYDGYDGYYDQDVPLGVSEDQAKLIASQTLQRFVSKGLSASVEDIVNDFMEKKRKCTMGTMGPYAYYDTEIKDCRSCLDRDCSKNEMCSWECRDLLKIKVLQEQRLNQDDRLNEFEKKLSSIEGTNTAVFVMTAFCCGATVLFIILVAVYCGDIRNMKKDIQQAKVMKPSYDAAEERADAENAPLNRPESSSTLSTEGSSGSKTSIV